MPRINCIACGGFVDKHMKSMQNRKGAPWYWCRKHLPTVDSVAPRMLQALRKAKAELATHGVVDHEVDVAIELGTWVIDSNPSG